MKKYLLLLLVIGFFGIALGQDESSGMTSESNIEPGQVKVLNQDLAPVGEGGDINSIKLFFCNEMEKDIFTRDLGLSMRPGQRRDICILLSNNSGKPINVLLGFTEGITEEGGKMSCGSDVSYTNKFSKYILNGPTTGIIVPASGNFIQRVQYLAPKTASGDMFGCIAYKINQEEVIESGQMFLVIARKIAPIYINITGDVYNFGRRDDISGVIVTNKRPILIVIIAILAVRLGVTLFKTTKGKGKHHRK